MLETSELSERQQRELEYHKNFAKSRKQMLSEEFDYDVVESKNRRWWNQYWAMYTFLLNKDLNNKTVLVIGCGFGEDTFNLARAGAKVSAFDLSPESIEIAQAVAKREGLDIDFRVMAAEKLSYSDNQFDIVIARDILHHVEIDKTMNEIIRTSKPNGILLFNEVYSHSIFKRIRYSKIIDKWLYPKMVSFVYKGKDPYITDDEDRLTEVEVSQISSRLRTIETRSYFNAFVTRVFPEKYTWMSKVDRMLLNIWTPMAQLLGSRVLMGGVIAKGHE